MAKVLRVAAVVVAIAAAIPSGGTSLLGAGLMQAGIAATATAASAIAGGLAIGLNLAVSLTAKKPKVSGVGSHMNHHDHQAGKDQKLPDAQNPEIACSNR